MYVLYIDIWEDPVISIYQESAEHHDRKRFIYWFRFIAPDAKPWKGVKSMREAMKVLQTPDAIFAEVWCEHNPYSDDMYHVVMANGETFSKKVK